MPRIGSILNEPLTVIENACNEANHKKKEIQDQIVELTARIAELDAQIKGYYYTHDILMVESNKV